MATLTPEVRASIIAQAQAKAKESGLSPEQVLHTYGVSQGLDNSQIDDLMGFESGATQKWSDGVGANRGNVSQQAKDLGFDIKTGSTSGQSVTGARPAQPAQPSTPASNLGMGGNYTAAQTYTPTLQTAPATSTANGYTPNMLGDAATYNATKANLGLGLSSLGASDPSKANAQLLSGQVNNPYLDQQADNITKRLNRNLQENILPGIGQGATMAGQYGGSRQGIAQGKAIGDTQDNLANALTNMYSGANEAAQGRMAGAAGQLTGVGANLESQNANAANQAGQWNAGAQNSFSMANQNAQNSAAQYSAGLTAQNNQFNTAQANAMSMANQNASNQAGQFNAGATNNYNLGLRSSDLGFAGLDANIAQNNFGNNLASANFGLNVYNTLGQQNANATNTATNVQNTPMNYQNNYGSAANAGGGMGGSNTGSVTGNSNPWLGAVGGAQVGNAWQYPKP